MATLFSAAPAFAVVLVIGVSLTICRLIRPPTVITLSASMAAPVTRWPKIELFAGKTLGLNRDKGFLL